ncbi:MAG: F0F1 ATP synthase subunit B [Pseudonocardiales bacterium]|nr:F0F1 ATP synthase subunit B [Pseudonocardiales bacterium]MBV9727910.1 F0F1 ATP synthase subunit B [Pseudonocardiales bacterium]
MAAQGGGNLFLIPNATFFVELVIFLVVLGVIWRYVVPPVKRAMGERQEMVRRQIQESQQASKRLAEAQARYSEALAQARVEAAKIREAARADAQEIKDEMRQQAEQEVARIRERGAEQLATQREQVVRELRGELGKLAVTLAGRIVGESVADDARRAGTVDRFLDELEGMATPESVPENVTADRAVSVPNGRRRR